jgi:hypothetical protein
MGKGGDSNERGPRGRFKPGNPGGPGGQHRRGSDLRRAAIEAFTPERIAAMIRKATIKALEGDLAAMRFVFDQTCGRPAEAPVEAAPMEFSLPPLHTADDCARGAQLLIEAFTSGRVNSQAAKVLLEMIQTRLKAIEVTELDERLTQLEQAADLAPGRRT